MNYPHLARRLFNTPLAIHPRKGEIITSALSDRLGLSGPGSCDLSVYDDEDPFTHAHRGDPGYDNLEGIAVIPVQGTLVNKLGTLRPYSGMTGYDSVRQAFLCALADPAVKGVCLDIDSPGGEVAGCFDLADEIYFARGRKPVHAILSECAYSAAYAIASAADHISLPRTGGIGSIGVIMMHVDTSRQLDKEGLKVTLITFGDRKAETHPCLPLSDTARQALQAEADAAGELFISTVARNRGISEDAVRDTHAACFMAPEGIRLGLADAIAAPDVAFNQLMEIAGV